MVNFEECGGSRQRNVLAVIEIFGVWWIAASSSRIWTFQIPDSVLTPGSARTGDAIGQALVNDVILVRFNDPLTLAN